MNEVIELLNKRKSVRVFTDREITPEEKAIILNAAAQAPSAGNQQLYTIIDVTDRQLKEELAKTCDNQPFIAKGKMVLVFCADCLKWYKGFQQTGCQPRKPGAGDLLLAVSDANIAAENAVIAAESLGIGSCYIGDIMIHCEIERKLLNLPEYVFPAAMLVFGFPEESQITREKPKRAPMDRIVSENAYPEITDEHLEALFAYKATARDYEDWMKAFCARKFNADFSVEMTRSVNEYLKDFMQ